MNTHLQVCECCSQTIFLFNREFCSCKKIICFLCKSEIEKNKNNYGSKKFKPINHISILCENHWLFHHFTN